MRQCQIAPVTARQARSFVALLDAVTARAKMLFRVISSGALDTAAEPQQNLTSGHRPSGACRSEKERKEKDSQVCQRKGSGSGFQRGTEVVDVVDPPTAEFRLLPPDVLCWSKLTTSPCNLSRLDIFLCTPNILSPSSGTVTGVDVVQVRWRTSEHWNMTHCYPRAFAPAP